MSKNLRLTDRDFQDLFELETSLHKKEVRSSPAAVAALLADDFIEFGSSGRVYNKMAVIELLRTEAVAADQKITVEKFVVRELSPNVALVTYLFSKSTLRSSIWRLSDSRWQMIFHQGTRISQ
jgi:hypothetical protein